MRSVREMIRRAPSRHSPHGGDGGNGFTNGGTGKRRRTGRAACGHLVSALLTTRAAGRRRSDASGGKQRWVFSESENRSWRVGVSAGSPALRAGSQWLPFVPVSPFPRL
jgi:hypothetical protein